MTTASSLAKRVHQAKRPCVWAGCPAPGKLYTGRMHGLETRWGYACSEHERRIAGENLERAAEQTARRCSPGHV